MVAVGLLIFAVGVAALASLVKLVGDRLTRRTLRFRYALLGVLLAAFAVFFVIQRNLPSDRDRIERTIEAASTSDDPAVCTADETRRFLEQSTGEPAPFADDYCEAWIGSHRAESVDISDLSIDGDRATAAITNSGGPFDGSSLRVRLVKDGRYWKVNQLAGFAHFDREGFRRAYRRSFLEFGGPPAAAACAVARERRLSDPRLERELLTGRRGGFARIAAECDPAGVRRSLAAQVAFARSRLPTDAVECVQARIGTEPPEVLARLQVDLIALGKIIVQCDSDAYVAYLRRTFSKAEQLDPAATRCALSRIHHLSVPATIRISYDEERLRELAARCRA